MRNGSGVCQKGLIEGWRRAGAVLAAALGVLPVVPAAAEPLKLAVAVEGLEKGGYLPLSSAFCVPPSIPPEAHNISPGVSWSKGPPGTLSYALIMTDLDVPADLSLINKPGVTLDHDTPRVPFIHWVLIDIPASMVHLDKGAESAGFIAKGTPIGPTPHGIRGANVYSGYYPRDSPLAGPHGGYDGPCPPPNDTISHRYVTQIYALDVKTLGLSGIFFGEEVEKKLSGHVLAMGEAYALYGSSAKAPGTDRDRN